MSIQRVGGTGMLIPDPYLATSNVFDGTPTVLAAAGSALHFSGHVLLEPGFGSKTISSAGGKIHFRSSTVTFASASTTFRAGIQDVSAASGPPGRGDGTYDVYGDLVGGTNTIASVAMVSVPMGSGSKTVAHGDKISIVFEMTARGGSDSVTIFRAQPTYGLCQWPVSTTYISATWARVTGTAVCCIEFDDGTIGWLFGSVVFSTAAQTQTYNASSGTANEYGLLIRSPLQISTAGAFVYLQPVTGASDFEICLYSDALNSPVLIEAVSVDATAMSTTGGLLIHYAMWSQPRILAQNTNYAITVRPTTSGDVSLNYWDVASAAMMNTHPLGQNCFAVRRLNNAGAFSEWNGGTAKTRRMVMGIVASGFHDAWGDARAQSLIGV